MKCQRVLGFHVLSENRVALGNEMKIGGKTREIERGGEGKGRWKR